MINQKTLGKFESQNIGLPFLKRGSKERLVKLAVYKNVQQNSQAVEQLLKESQKLYAVGKKKQAKNLLDIADGIVNNNKELQETVGDVLNDS